MGFVSYKELVFDSFKKHLVLHYSLHIGYSQSYSHMSYCVTIDGLYVSSIFSLSEPI